jgi:serine/threonine protein kinase
MDPLYIEVIGARSAPAELPRQGKLVIGSSGAKASFVVEGQGVADVHCAIGRIKGGGWALRDLGSEFGTLLNGEPVKATRLNDGDEILLGSKKLRIFSLAAGKGAVATALPAESPAEPPEPEELVLPEPTPVREEVPKPRPAARTASAGTPTIPGYKVDRLLGRGAMGDVYLSTQESLDRRVALKVLKPKLAGDQVFVQRFKDEARAAARLNHPNIVTVFDVGQSEELHFLSMEFMAGGSIEARLEELGPLPWREALDVLRDAAAGLVYAESRGIVHRDIKPENLMRNQDGVTKIADLGLAVQVEQETFDSSGGKIFGTPHFIAPEIAKGEPADARGDLYALGVTAYRVLSGKTPFEGPTSRDILRAAMTEEPAKLGTLVPGLPARLEAVIHRLLEKDPDRRPPSASILLKELVAIRAGDPGTAAPVTAEGPRSKVGLLAGAVAVAAAAAAYVAFSGGEANSDELEPFRGSGGSSSAEAPEEASSASSTTSASAPGGAPDGDARLGGEKQTSSAGDAESGAASSAAGPAVKEARPAVEAEFEYQAERAFLALGEELLTPADRAARLRALAEQFAGTDAAGRALDEAGLIESGASAATEVAAAREAGLAAALGALTTAADFEASPFHPGQALRAMNLIVAPGNLATDPEYTAGRAALVDRAMKIGLARGRAAMTAADQAAARGDLTGTRDPLREFVGLADLPTAKEAPLLVGEGAPASVKEFGELASAARDRLRDLRGKEAEFEAIRTAQERAAVAAGLGGKLESDLRQFSLTSARVRLEQAAELTSDGDLSGRLRGLAAALDGAQRALDGLIEGWKDPGWRRRGVIDPRAGGNASVLGTAPGALVLEADGGPRKVPLAQWAANPKALDNLFKGRLDRSWSPDEEAGIVTLMGLSASLQLIDAFSPALQADARRISRSEAADALQAFSKVQDWVEKAPGTAKAAARQRDAGRLLAEAMMARQDGDWPLCASLLQRLLDENRDTWIVMLLSDGNTNQ